MSETNIPRRRRQAAMAVFVCVLAALAAGAIMLATLDRQRAIHVASPYTALGAPQETPLDNLGLVPYAIALGVCVTLLLRSARHRDRWPLWVMLTAITLWLLWRELPWDEQLVGANTFSWAKYAGDASVALWLRVVFVVGSAGLTVALLIYAACVRRSLWRLIREKTPSLSQMLLGLSALSLLAAQMLDKHKLTRRLLSLDLSTWPLAAYCEEVLELFGATLLAMTCLMAALEEPGHDQAAR
jgi:hypothetical protein